MLESASTGVHAPQRYGQNFSFGSTGMESRAAEPFDFAALDGVAMRPRILQKGQSLYRTGEPLVALFAVRAGSCKSYARDSQSREHVRAFHLPGDLLGFDGFGAGRYACTAVALETTAVSVIASHDLLTLSGRQDRLCFQLLRLLSQGLDEAAVRAGDFTAEERFAAFLLGLSRRFERHGLSPHEFHLSMSRRDIANHLRLTPETVSRLLARFETEGLVAAERRLLRIQDPAGLKARARCVEESLQAA